MFVLTRKITTENVTTLLLMYKGGNSDPVLLFFSSLATPVSQLYKPPTCYMTSSKI